MPGKLFVIATPLGHLDDLSPRAREALRTADCIACEDTRRTSTLLARFEIATPLVSCHKFNEKARLEPLLRKLAEGRIVALVSDAGTPGVADPGALLVRAAVEAGHEVSPLPGPSAVTALLSVSGFSADRFMFEGFLPHRAGERRRVLRELSSVTRPLVVYETPHRIREALEDVRAVMGDRALVLGRELTKVHETILRGTAGEVRVGVYRGFHGAPRLAVAGFPDVIEIHDGATRADAHPVHDPLVVGADVQVFEKCVADLVFRMEVPDAVQEYCQRKTPEMCSPPSTRITSPLIQAASGVESR